LEKILALPMKVEYPVMPVMHHLLAAESPAYLAFLGKNDNLCSNVVYHFSTAP
jgi:hypothetical protein